MKNDSFKCSSVCLSSLYFTHFVIYARIIFRRPLGWYIGSSNLSKSILNLSEFVDSLPLLPLYFLFSPTYLQTYWFSTWHLLLTMNFLNKAFQNSFLKNIWLFEGGVAWSVCLFASGLFRCWFDSHACKNFLIFNPSLLLFAFVQCFCSVCCVFLCCC